MNVWITYEFYNHDITDEIKIGDLIKIVSESEIVMSKSNGIFYTNASIDNSFIVKKGHTGHYYIKYGKEVTN